MKKIALALALCLVVVGVMAAPALAAAQKLVLAPVATDETGGGFVVLNNSANSDGNNLEITVSLKGGVPGREYGVWLWCDGVCLPDPSVPFGSTTANAQGNANFHVNTAIGSGEHTVYVSLWKPELPCWPEYYRTATVTMTFK